MSQTNIKIANLKNRSQINKNANKHIMEETVVLTPVVESAPLWLNPLTWIVAFIILGLAYELFWGKRLKKSSTKCCESNKTSTPTKPPVAKKPVAKKNASKKPVAKKMPKKKATAKRTPKKSGK